jgi:hypothetical protein
MNPAPGYRGSEEERRDVEAIEALEARELAELLSEPVAMERSTLDPARLTRHVVTVDDPAMAYAPSTPRPRISPDYAGSENEKRDQEAEEVLAALKSKKGQ